MKNPQFAKMPWYPRDFASATRGWPLVARGVYRELLDGQWDLDGLLPDNEEVLRAMAGATPAEWKIAWPYVGPKFPIVPGGRRNARLEEHRELLLRNYRSRAASIEKVNSRRLNGHASADE